MPEEENTPDEQAGASPEPETPESGSPGATGDAAPAEGGVDDALNDAQESVRQTQAEVDKAVAGEAAPFTPPEFTDAGVHGAPASIELLSDVNLNVKIELGRTRLLVEDVLRLGEGAVVELDKLAGDPVDIYVNDRHVAKGEVLVLNDNFCVRVSEILEGLTDAARAAAKD